MTYQEMNDGTPRFCMSRSFGLKSWAYCKIVIDIILIILMIDPIISTFYYFTLFEFLGALTFGIPTVLVFADIVFQAKLSHGLRKNKLEHLTAYCKYTKVLWVLMLMYIVLFTFICLTGIVGPIMWRHNGDVTLLAHMCTMLVTTFFQTIMMWLVIKEIKKLKGEIDEVSASDNSSCSGTLRIFNIGFSIKIESSKTEKTKENDTVNNNNNNVEETNEKAKLTV